MIDWLLQTMTNSKKNPITKLDDLGELLIKRMTDSEKKLVVELLPLFEANNIAEAGKLFTENYPRNGLATVLTDGTVYIFGRSIEGRSSKS